MKSNSNGDLRKARFEKLQRSVVGGDTAYTLATGEKTRRIYLDSTASTLQLGVVHDVLEKFHPFYANTHTVSHFGAKLSTAEYTWVHDTVLDFVNADPKDYACFFVGSGATGGLNRIARTMKEKRPDRDVVITTIMEHHSNDLPHRRHYRKVVHVPVAMAHNALGCVDITQLEEALKAHEGKVNYIAVTGVSNVTGIINPIYDIAELAHRYDALIVVDAAQMAAHVPIQMSDNENPDRDLDILVFSGHKIYAPGSPGVVITKKDLFLGVMPDEVGGGMVERVFVDHYAAYDHFPDREEAGTPNISGAIALGAALYALKSVGMDYIQKDEDRLLERALAGLKSIDDLIVYGETDWNACHRAGAISFNIKDMHHSLTACILNDYFNISVRNACFCAHPYVREMISEELGEHFECLTEKEMDDLVKMRRGMVRASFGVYNTEKDVDSLVAALKDICARREFYVDNYELTPAGRYVHKSFTFDHTKHFSIKGEVDAFFG